MIVENSAWMPEWSVIFSISNSSSAERIDQAWVCKTTLIELEIHTMTWTSKPPQLNKVKLDVYHYLLLLDTSSLGKLRTELKPTFGHSLCRSEQIVQLWFPLRFFFFLFLFSFEHYSMIFDMNQIFISVTITSLKSQPFYPLFLFSQPENSGHLLPTLHPIPTLK